MVTRLPEATIIWKMYNLIIIVHGRYYIGQIYNGNILPSAVIRIKACIIKTKKVPQCLKM